MKMSLKQNHRIFEIVCFSVATIIGNKFKFLELNNLNLISDEVQFMKTRKGQPMLIDKNGFYYYKHKNSQKDSSKVFWRCQKKDHPHKCLARATTDGFYIIKYLNEHNHPGPSESFEKE